MSPCSPLLTLSHFSGDWTGSCRVGAPKGECSGSLFIFLLCTHLPHNFWGWLVVELISNGLARTSFSICSSKRKKIILNLQHGIFPVILNKFQLFVLGIQIRITALHRCKFRVIKGILTAIATTSPSFLRSDALAAVRGKCSI